MEPHCSLMFHLLKTPSPTVSAFPGLRSHPSLNAFPAPSRSLSSRTITCAPPNIICCFSDSVLVLVFQRTRTDMSTYVPLAPGSQLLPSGYLDTCMYLGKGVTEGGGVARWCRKSLAVGASSQNPVTGSGNDSATAARVERTKVHGGRQQVGSSEGGHAFFIINEGRRGNVSNTQNCARERVCGPPSNTVRFPGIM